MDADGANTAVTNAEHEEGAAIVLKPAVFEEAIHSIARSNINEKTLKQYCRAYQEFVCQVKTLPCPETGKAAEVIEWKDSS